VTASQQSQLANAQATAAALASGTAAAAAALGSPNDPLKGNPFAPEFQHATQASALAASAGVLGASGTAGNGPAVKVYGPAQNFWDKHPADDKLVPLFRYWNSAIRDHFYTVDFGVFGGGRESWVYQGIQCYVYPTNEAGTVPLYRYWSSKLLDDYYTVSANVTTETGYELKGVAAYVAPTQLPGTEPLFRYWSQELADHYYTTDYNVMGPGRDGWVLQGIAAYVWPHPSQWIPAGLQANNTSPDAIPGHLLAPTQFVEPIPAESTGNETATPPATPALEAQASTQTPLLVPLYRYWNSVNRDHFYTTQWSEIRAGGRDGWEYQGVQALVYANPQPGTAAFHRYWNIRTLDHFYTTNFAALEKGGKDGWVYEGIQCYIDENPKADNVPLYRYFSQKYLDHFYTTKFIGQEARTWTYEGIQGYVMPSFFTDC
jgi:hypothetical protein